MLKESINVRLVATNKDLIIHMRDDCKTLNIKEYYKFLSTLEEKVELSIILKMPKEVIYTPIFGANNLLIKI